MTFKHLFSFKTTVGTFYVSRSTDGRYHPVFAEESLGSYHSPEAAADDLAGGHTFSASGVKDTSTLGISFDLVEWNKLT